MSKLREMRLSKGMTLAQVAEIVGVTKPTVHATEMKGIYNVQTAKRYAKAFKCPAYFLLEGLDNASN